MPSVPNTASAMFCAGVHPACSTVGPAFVFFAASPMTKRTSRPRKSTVGPSKGYCAGIATCTSSLGAVSSTFTRATQRTCSDAEVLNAALPNSLGSSDSICLGRSSAREYRRSSPSKRTSSLFGNGSAGAPTSSRRENDVKDQSPLLRCGGGPGASTRSSRLRPRSDWLPLPSRESTAGAASDKAAICRSDVCRNRSDKLRTLRRPMAFGCTGRSGGAAAVSMARGLP
mmetsp:Transcript_8539/g.28107  ORF Transcript_8539/g.28107 Transcript_8539/m.28107 type:complete len:228 (-) Transcript_8539:477-1160(-)